MKVLRLKPGMEILDPADPLGPPLGVVGDGFASIVVRTHATEPIEAIHERAKLIRSQMAIARKGAKAALDRRRRRRNNAP